MTKFEAVCNSGVAADVVYKRESGDDVIIAMTSKGGKLEARRPIETDSQWVILADSRGIDKDLMKIMDIFLST